MTIVAHCYPFVIGVDTHAKTHTYAIIDTTTAQLVGCQTFPTTAPGIARALAWVKRGTSNAPTALWAIECAATYGAQLAHTVTQAGYEVAEAPRTTTPSQRGTGKSDPLDAHAIAVATLAISHDKLRRPRADDGVRHALRVLIAARDHITQQKTMNTNALTALLRVNDLGIDARKPLTGTHISEVSRWRSRDEPLALAVARDEAVRLARQILAFKETLASNHKRMQELITYSPAAPLLDQPGIGPYTAAIIIAAWSHPGRVRSEAAFAALAGTSPIPASSGNTIRHRLNRGGDRRLNHALHIIAISRMKNHSDTKTYIEKRLAQGRTNREIRRCLKRYIARDLYRTLNTLHHTPATT
ncbi:IS110 family transposase [Populibacterium corticicola]|uniref:IS110 family transposase n=1 Tax=Populibacterium corticicola TaxID=1812826 RepID=A0ABW5XIZ1_9MICO